MSLQVSCPFDSIHSFCHRSGFFRGGRAQWPGGAVMKPEESPRRQWPPPWLDGVRRRVGRWCASGAGTTWVVAVSGGSDSVGLLRVLHALAPELGWHLSVAHLDHGVRGEVAEADAHFV